MAPFENGGEELGPFRRGWDEAGGVVGGGLEEEDGVRGEAGDGGVEGGEVEGGGSWVGRGG